MTTEQLIERLYSRIVKETIKGTDRDKIQYKIYFNGYWGCCWCNFYTLNENKITIGLEVPDIEARAKLGYDDDYYKGRAERINKLILHNKIKSLEFILYHELKHAEQELRGIRNLLPLQEREKQADDWAVNHLENKKTDRDLAT